MLKNWTDRVGYCIASRGSHLNEIIFLYYPVSIVFSKKKIKFEKIFSSFFLKHFPKQKRYLEDPIHEQDYLKIVWVFANGSGWI